MSFLPQFFCLSGTQTGLVSGGSHSFTISLQSGGCVINGVVFYAPLTFQGGATDSKQVMRPGTNITLSGANANSMTSYGFW